MCKNRDCMCKNKIRKKKKKKKEKKGLGNESGKELK
jgi:hypothetical protein